MTTAASSDVHWICPSCDAEPAALPTDGLCPNCNSRLIEVRSRAEDLTGVVVDGRFEIRGLLGQGGMGAVYRAWQRSIGREVAIKLIDERHGRDPMAVRRFLREARLASQLSQPNTVSVLDFGQSTDGRLFIAMELVRGRTLSEVLATEGPFSPSRAAWIGVQLCDALDAAHRLQIVHRDLKPANVVLLDDPPGRDLIKVLDFGLAKSLAESETKATDTGLVVGTPRYMSPEVILGERPTAQSDLYAVGVILGELATGKLMWDATSFPALAGQKLQGSPVIHELPLGLRGVVARLIDPDIARRPASASEARALLRPVVTDVESSAPVPALSTSQVDDAISQPRGALTPGPGLGPRSTVPPIDPTLPQVAATTAPGTAAAARRISGAGEAAATPPAAKVSPSSVLAAAARAGDGVDAPRSTDRLRAVDGDAREGQGGRRGLVIGGLAVVAIAAVVIVIVMTSRGGSKRAKEVAGGGTGGDHGVPAVAIDAAAAPALAPVDAAPAAVTPDVDAAPPAAATVDLDVRSSPSGASITIDGKSYGATPRTVSLPQGTAPVVIDLRSGRLSARQRVVPDHAQTINLTLRGKGGTPF
ncbi:MAG TPA: protein kinase [Kofleriaceae bacterium]|nr:protein kinase [Kofleriaceae bacterium]